ncbi:MAG TPA: oligosaccharide flippase family protein [Anaerolineae bacterium]
MRRGRGLDAAIGLFLLLLPLLWFWPQAIGHKTLLPADNLYQYAPWSSFAKQMGAQVPYNPLISDLVLENLPWKSFIIEALHSGQLPLWNDRLFAGVPFLAAGQHSALYPLSLIFYVLPLWRAYGVFTWLQLGLAALGTYIFGRVLRLRRPAATLAGIAFAFSGFYIVSVNFTMIIAAAAWLPYLLAVIELMARGGEQASLSAAGQPDGEPPRPRLSRSLPPLVAAGALLLFVQVLAGHIEITYYVLLVSALYAVWRLAGVWRRVRSARRVAGLAGWMLAATVLGMLAGGVQLAPLFELVTQSFREGSASLAQVRDWAWPSRQILTFVLPDVFGNPTHHSYFDIWARTWRPVNWTNTLGQVITNVDWGTKNYVEGGNYLGLVTLLLAALAVGVTVRAILAGRRQREGAAPAGIERAAVVIFFAVLTVLSLLFAFGTPLYAVLYYGLPGYKQLHSAFRWVYPYTLSMAILAGFGLNYLLAAAEGQFGATLPLLRRSARALGGLAAVAGACALGIVAASLVVRGPFLRLGQMILNWSILARTRGFSGPEMAWSYEAMGLARFGAIALLAGLLLFWAARQPAADPEARRGLRGRLAPIWAIGIIGLLVADLWVAGHGFNPAVDPRLLDFKPPVVDWLQSHQDPAQPWRLTSYEKPVASQPKILLANSAMRYGLEDVRGYDSIIPRQYVDFMQRHQTQSELLYNRIAPTYAPKDGQAGRSLDDPWLNLLGVRYVLSTEEIKDPAYRLVYDQEIKVYQNTKALPRAFVAPQAQAAADETAALDRVGSLDARQTVVLENAGGVLPAASDPASRAQPADVSISRRTMKEVFVDVKTAGQGWLVLTDNYFPGWKAYLRPFGAQGEGMDAKGQSVEDEVPVYRADGTFRAVYLPKAGQWTVRFVYSPRSFLLGGYGTFLALVTLFLILGAWAWSRYYRGERSEVATVAKNSVVQVFMSLVNKVIDFAFAMLRLRILNPAGEGSFTLAINFYMIFDIITRFGLGTLLTRDVAAERGQARRYLANVVVLRCALWLVSLPLMFLLAYFYQVRGRLTPEEGQAIAIFAGALFFSNIAEAITSVFNAYEKMEYPAGLATATAVTKVALGGLVLLPPLNMGFVGLAWVSLITNVIQVIWLYAVMEAKVLPPTDHRPWHILDFRLQRTMLSESGPLMINNLLANVFWRLGVWILFDFGGAVAVGIFSAGTKYLDGINIIPAYFTLAIFPLMSRYARNGTEGMQKAYRLAVQLLLMVALPIAVFFTFAATPLIQVLGGSAFLPDSAIALRVMIWSIPIGFMNSVTQYALIAVGQQRFLTRAFVIGVVVTALVNLALAPRLGYLAAAIAMIPAELSLFAPFAWAVHRHVAPISWLNLCRGPVLGTLINVAIVAGLQRVGAPLVVALLAGGLAYLAALALAGTFRSPDFVVLWSQLHLRLPWQRQSPVIGSEQ